MIYLLCGVPGSGKTWVIDQLHNIAHVDHDSHSRQKLIATAKSLAYASKKPIVIDCPFDERSLKAELEACGLEVIPIFIVEEPSVVEARYMKRERKAPSQNVLTRANTIMNKVREWGAFYGTSNEVLTHLRELVRRHE
jgi:hypothetical protein